MLKQLQEIVPLISIFNNVNLVFLIMDFIKTIIQELFIASLYQLKIVKSLLTNFLLIVSNVIDFIIFLTDNAMPTKPLYQIVLIMNLLILVKNVNKIISWVIIIEGARVKKNLDYQLFLIVWIMLSQTNPYVNFVIMDINSIKERALFVRNKLHPLDVYNVKELIKRQKFAVYVYPDFSWTMMENVILLLAIKFLKILQQTLLITPLIILLPIIQQTQTQTQTIQPINKVY